jgi:hypothetical protein
MSCTFELNPHSKRKKGAAAHSPLSNRVSADARIKIKYREAIKNKAHEAATKKQKTK